MMDKLSWFTLLSTGGALLAQQRQAQLEHVAAGDDPKQAIIVRKPMDYLLPDDGINKNYVLAREDYYFVYPTNYHEYERQYRDTFQHGGISLEEMVLPLIMLEPK